MEDECKRLVAHYLQTNGFTSTLQAFEAEASPPSRDAGSLDLQSLVKAWLSQDALSKELEKTSLSAAPLPYDHEFDWHSPISRQLPSRITKTIRTIHLSSVLSVTYCNLPKRSFDTSTATYRSDYIPCIVTSSADKRVVFTSVTEWNIEDEYEPAKSATLSVRLNPKYPYLMLSGAMDGSCTVTNLLTRESQQMKEHSKYIVRTAFSDDGLWFCTLAYDKSICVWEVVPSTNLAGDASLDNDEFAQTPEYFRYHLRWRKSLPTNPEACLFLPGSTHLAFTRRDDNHLQYIKLPEHSQQPDMVYSADAWEITRYNLNETLDAHISFSILSIALHPSKQALSLQTDTAIARIILLPFHSSTRLRETLYTSAEQSDYSNPRHVWLSDGSGVVVSSDDGIIRIVSLDGKVTSRIGAHGLAAPQDQEPVPLASDLLRARYQSDRGSSVVRDLCVLPDNTVVSVGLDKTVRIAAP